MLGPVGENFAVGVVETHGYRIENEVTFCGNKTLLDQFAAIDGAIAWCKVVVVGFANK